MQKLSEYLSEEFVLIESPFVETTRKGKYLQTVNIALTPKTLMITSSTDENYQFTEDTKTSHCNSHHPLENTKLQVFKKSRRQSIKVCFDTASPKYFELDHPKNKKIFWTLWCRHVGELNGGIKKWPFIRFRSEYQNTEEHWNKKKIQQSWADKYLYLGSRRVIEDNERPKPVPGLGPTEDIKLLYLKPKYFGCWDQSEHWVQCGNSSSTFNDSMN